MVIRLEANQLANRRAIDIGNLIVNNWALMYSKCNTSYFISHQEKNR